MIFNEKFYNFILIIFLVLSCKINAQDIKLVTDGKSEYTITLPAKPTSLEQKSAIVLQKYIKQISGCELKITKEEKHKKQLSIYIGLTDYANNIHPTKLKNEGYLIKTKGDNIIIIGGSGKGLIYGVYSFLENFLGCKKISNQPAIVPTSKTIEIPANISDEHIPQFEYREAYYPSCDEAEFLEWNKLQKFEDLWGLWGHTFNKLLPAKTWFKSHPEYYSLVKGVRQPMQLCLSNDDVFKIVVEDLKKKIADNQDAMYWSVSQNDDIGYCECPKCKQIDEAEGGPQGSLITFVNRIAKQFPDKKITTLAYGYTHRAPKKIKPENNVYIFLCPIDAYRDKPLQDEGTASSFRKDLKDWGELSKNIFIWDYVTQFTNYLAPFPNIQTLQSNIQYFLNNGVKGIFEQGSGDTYSEFAELRCYLLAKLLEDSKVDIDKLTNQFLNEYYGTASAKYLVEYINLIKTKMIESKQKLDIYGNPVNNFNTWLSPENIEIYSDLFDKAENAAEGNTVFLERIIKCRLALEYTVIQQARFYGIEKHGIFIKTDGGDWIVKPKFKEKISVFISTCKKAGVKELAEGGLTPDQYKTEWDSIFIKGVTPTKAIGSKVTFKYLFAADYPAKGNSTIIDGNPGYLDFSYNWLCFYGTDMIATIELNKPIPITKIKIDFLDDPRHWIFLPEKILIEVSTDDKEYKQVAEIKTQVTEEHYEKSIKSYLAEIKLKKKETVRYIRVSASNLSKLPEWRTRDNKKSMIACDEVYVE